MTVAPKNSPLVLHQKMPSEPIDYYGVEFLNASPVSITQATWDWDTLERDHRAIITSDMMLTRTILFSYRLIEPSIIAEKPLKGRIECVGPVGRPMSRVGGHIGMSTGATPGRDRHETNRG